MVNLLVEDARWLLSLEGPSLYSLQCKVLYSAYYSSLFGKFLKLPMIQLKRADSRVCKDNLTYDTTSLLLPLCGGV